LLLWRTALLTRKLRRGRVQDKAAIDGGGNG